LQKTDLIMPLKGYITEGLLQQNVGRYLTTGSTLAMVQSEKDIQLILEVPEHDGILMQKGQKAYIRLLAFPGTSVEGIVSRVEPAPRIEEGYNRVFQVEILVDRHDLPWKPGITGYAKVHVGWKPLGLVLLRPLARFFYVEIWSWFP
ncbi:MAG: HlyD family efflux transporter periplasmic adaptor subunit, partial [Okeania sp. SIO3H1]|nr:HlyD family efflux transporter periplasmic adaptor subunit [Okeania sp. SIO3H1]